MNTFSVFIGLIIIVCVLLIIVIMVQNPKGGGLSSSFGGGAQQLGSVKSTTDFLDKSTWILGSSVLILILLSNFALNNNNENINESKLIDDFENIEEIIPEVLPEIPEQTEPNN